MTLAPARNPPSPVEQNCPDTVGLFEVAMATGATIAEAVQVVQAGFTDQQWEVSAPLLVERILAELAKVDEPIKAKALVAQFMQELPADLTASSRMLRVLTDIAAKLPKVPAVWIRAYLRGDDKGLKIDALPKLPKLATDRLARLFAGGNDRKLGGWAWDVKPGAIDECRVEDKDGFRLWLLQERPGLARRMLYEKSQGILLPDRYGVGPSPTRDEEERIRILEGEWQSQELPPLPEDVQATIVNLLNTLLATGAKIPEAIDLVRQSVSKSEWRAGRSLCARHIAELLWGLHELGERRTGEDGWFKAIEKFIPINEKKDIDFSFPDAFAFLEDAVRLWPAVDSVMATLSLEPDADKGQAQITWVNCIPFLEQVSDRELALLADFRVGSSKEMVKWILGEGASATKARVVQSQSRIEEESRFIVWIAQNRRGLAERLCRQMDMGSMNLLEFSDQKPPKVKADPE